MDNPENQTFLKEYKEKYGSNAEVAYPAAMGYIGVMFWAQALRDSPTTEPTRLREHLLRQSMATPGGAMYIDPTTANTWGSVFIERINASGQRELVWNSIVPIEPIVYPEFKTTAEWTLFEYKLFVGWGNAWEKRVDN